MRAKICVFDQDLDKIYFQFTQKGNLGITPNELCQTMGNLLEVSNSQLREHSEKVAVISYMLSLEFGIPPKLVDLIQVAGYFHNLGMILISNGVLNGARPLNYQEIDLIKKHPVVGADCLRHIKLFSGRGSVTDIVLYHHERWDGSRYPFGSKGKEILLGARILAVAYTLTKLTDGNPIFGQKALGFDTALDMIGRGSGTQFDPLVVSALLNVEHKVRYWLVYC